MVFAPHIRFLLISKLSPTFAFHRHNIRGDLGKIIPDMGYKYIVELFFLK
jgi:hypothetical protein